MTAFVQVPATGLKESAFVNPTIQGARLKFVPNVVKKFVLLASTYMRKDAR